MVNGSDEDEAATAERRDFARFLFKWLMDLANRGIERRDEKMRERGLSATASLPMEITRLEFIDFIARRV
jgi:hypothetical protein